MKTLPSSILFLSAFLFFTFSTGCSNFDQVAEEENSSAFKRGRSYLKVGKNEEALDEFLSITRRMVNCPKSHLEVGRLYLTLNARKDPVAAVYHFRRYLFLEPSSREAPKVKQLIVTAEREIIRNLPGKPYAGYLNGLVLQEENLKLHREVADLKARLGMPLSESLKPKIAGASPMASAIATPSPKSVAPQAKPPVQSKSYVVQKGDSLYLISRKFYGDSSHIDRIYQANRGVMKSKNSLQVGQTLRIPPSSGN
ncbi:MAG: LysM peptidoglycan-binding domain-containing protein [Opitutales bacterium]|nr:LysM peptidoglycan-binding domain-containing protein [Opitutales bacterium]